MAGNGQRRVVITGIGAVTPLGNDAETSWQRLVAGESGAGPITQFDATDYHVHFACEVKDFDPSNWIEDRKSTRLNSSHVESSYAVFCLKKKKKTKKVLSSNKKKKEKKNTKHT